MSVPPYVENAVDQHITRIANAGAPPAERAFANGLIDLVSVIPPGAELSPFSRISSSQIGKIPGRRNTSGTWGGYDWRKITPTLDDVRRWCADGASFGLRSDRFPGVDIDCLDPQLATLIEETAHAFLGAAPVRFGRRPKRLLMYRTNEPFGRMRLWIEKDGAHHLVEILGQGQQYLVHGIHPSTLQPYEWTTSLADIRAAELTSISRERADAFLMRLSERLASMGYRVSREGDGRPLARAVGEQTALLSPSIELLREAVSLIPNTNELFPGRNDYLKMGYAIRAAGQEDLDEAFHIFAEWADRWEGNGRAPCNEPDVVLADWRRMKGPYSVGWTWIAEQARRFGFNDAALDFEATEPPPPPVTQDGEAFPFSDQWLAQCVVERYGDILRYVPEEGKFLVWREGRFMRDETLEAQRMILRELRLRCWQAFEEGGKGAAARARSVASNAKARAVAQVLQSHRAITVSIKALDANPFLLNTPGGIVDLRTGFLGPADPEALCTRSASVAPDFGAECPEWTRFLQEATGDDPELVAYLQRLAGYALTGDTREQHLTFIYGPGGNGKSVFLNVLTGILADYARIAPAEVFMASQHDRHTTEIAMLAGARLVTASETRSDRGWDEVRVKNLTGGEPITARFMRQDNFTYVPQFKLLIAGNHKPELENVGEAMRRRMHLVPFTVKPANVDRRLGEKLKEEWPAILAWMIDGCLAWQQHGLMPPGKVLAATQQYFEDQDVVGRWIDECCDTGVDSATDLGELHRAYSEWRNAHGERFMKSTELGEALANRGFDKSKHPRTRRVQFRGIAVRPRSLEDTLNC